MAFSILIEYADLSADGQLEKIGGTHADGTEWRLSHNKAVSSIEEGRWNFHIMKNGIATEVIVAKVRGGYKQLKALTDDKAENSFFALPQCPPVNIYGQAS